MFRFLGKLFAKPQRAYWIELQMFDNNTNKTLEHMFEYVKRKKYDSYGDHIIFSKIKECKINNPYDWDEVHIQIDTNAPNWITTFYDGEDDDVKV